MQFVRNGPDIPERLLQAHPLCQASCRLKI